MNVLDSLKDINSLVFDVDGVFTDGGLLVFENGDMLRKMNAKDGFAIRHAVNHGYQVIIITGGSSAGVKKRFTNLGLKHVYIGVHDKIALFNKLVEDHVIDPAKTLYMGDDLPDYHVMKEVKVAVCPQNAVPEIKDLSNIITQKKGGDGCVREIIETVLRLQDNWFQTS
jgi:3-deoxy-D-manno-octulosonate 8-phosphate phosphatase (KDO 8-P phosphatase)